MNVLLATNITITDAAVFTVAALGCLVGALGVVLARNTVHAALALVLTLFGIAVLFIEQEADFLAAVQVIVYAGAVVVLFLFVIMFLGVDRREEFGMEVLSAQRPVSAVLVAVVIGVLTTMMATAHWVTGAKHVAGATHGPFQNVNDLGRSVFTTYLFSFEVTAALLVIAVVGAVTLARRSGHATADGQLELDAFEPFPGGDARP
ncbi:MAG: NADH-quinone oxidoreductase subunit J [Actinomycetota bacterium]